MRWLFKTILWLGVPLLLTWALASALKDVKTHDRGAAQIPERPNARLAP